MAQDSLSPSTPQLQGLWDLWHARNAPDKLPMRSDFSDDDMRPYFGNVFIVDVLPGAPYFRFRLYGTSLVNAAAQELTGKTIDQVDISSYEPDVFADYHLVRDTGRPIARHRRFEPPPNVFTDHWRHYERLLIPLGNGGTKVEQILGCSFPLSSADLSETI